MIGAVLLFVIQDVTNWPVVSNTGNPALQRRSGDSTRQSYAEGVTEISLWFQPQEWSIIRSRSGGATEIKSGARPPVRRKNGIDPVTCRRRNTLKQDRRPECIRAADSLIQFTCLLLRGHSRELRKSGRSCCGISGIDLGENVVVDTDVAVRFHSLSRCCEVI